LGFLLRNDSEGSHYGWSGSALARPVAGRRFASWSATSAG
jgi:hypothetical protein